MEVRQSGESLSSQRTFREWDIVRRKPFFEKYNFCKYVRLHLETATSYTSYAFRGISPELERGVLARVMGGEGWEEKLKNAESQKRLFKQEGIIKTIKCCPKVK